MYDSDVKKQQHKIVTEMDMEQNFQNFGRDYCASRVTSRVKLVFS